MDFRSIVIGKFTEVDGDVTRGGCSLAITAAMDVERYFGVYKRQGIADGTIGDVEGDVTIDGTGCIRIYAQKGSS